MPLIIWMHLILNHSPLTDIVYIALTLTSQRWSCILKILNFGPTYLFQSSEGK